jgi:hypothetical protein
MTTDLSGSPALTAHRRLDAHLLHRHLRLVRPDLAVTYDGDRTVATGPISIHYFTRAVEIRFPHPFTNDNTDVAVQVPGQVTFPAVTAVVEGLLSGWQVTP